MRTRYLADANGHWIPESELCSQPVAPIVMPDIQPYQSMITGELIGSRSTHRAHLREHGCVEIGNETKHHFSAYDKIPDVKPEQRKEIIRAQIDAMSQDQFRKAIKRDADRVKWNSRED